MKIANNSNNRCGIFLFYDRDGIVDDYILYMLKDLRKSISHLLVVCNGDPGKEAVEKLKTESDDILIRANSGFDVGGYREGLFYIGFKELEKYDEIVLFNYTFFGGIFPFSEMFEKMNDMDLDFWGITKHHKVEYDPYGKNRYGYMPEHIQSHFLVLRKSLVCSDHYKEFIISMQNPASYVDSICDYETIFTKHFEDLGYKWSVYVNTDRYERYAYCPVMFYIKDMLEQDRCPIVKRRSFFTAYKDFLINTCGESSVEAYEYIRQHTDYDVNMIWDNILRVENMSEVAKVMHLNYCIPGDIRYQDNDIENMAVAIWVKDVSDLDFYEKYLNAITEEYSLYLYGEEEKAKQVEEKTANKNHVTIINTSCATYQEFIKVVKNSHIQNKAYYAFCVIDTVKKLAPYSNEVSNVYKDWECILSSADYLSNIKNVFEENERLGLAIPPVPDFGEYFAKLHDGWAGRFEEVISYLKEICVRQNIKKDISALVPIGGNFWITDKALFSSQMERALQLSVPDEVFLFALSPIVQDYGSYTGVLYSNYYAEIEMTNSDYMMRELNKVVFDKYGANYHSVVLERVENNILERDIIAANTPPQDNNWKARTKRKLKELLPENVYLNGKKVYFHLRGREYKE